MCQNTRLGTIPNMCHLIFCDLVFYYLLCTYFYVQSSSVTSKTGHKVTESGELETITTQISPKRGNLRGVVNYPVNPSFRSGELRIFWCECIIFH